MADLKAYEEKHRTKDDPHPVAKGIWYEVAFFNFIDQMFRDAESVVGAIMVHDWGSSEDRAGRDATIEFPELGIRVSIDVTTDVARKTAHALELEHAWFKGQRETLVVDEGKRVGGRLVSNLIRMAFFFWLQERVGPAKWQEVLDYVKRNG